MTRKYLKLELELEEPLIAHTLAGDPNNIATLPFIPGNLLRGAAIARYLRQHPGPLESNPTACQLFLDGTVRYLNAYPAAQNGERTLPTPFSLHQEKKPFQPIYDLSAEETGNLQRPVPINHPFCAITDNEAISFYTPARQLTIHNRRDRVAGRATEERGNVFRYEALAPGQTFIAIILYPEKWAEEVESLFSSSEPLFLGLSRSAGYGKIHITKAESKLIPKDWREGGDAARAIEAGASFSLLLLSDVLLRDEDGQDLGFLTPDKVSKALGAQVELVPEKTFSRHKLIGGFNRKWGMPLPQRWVARAGSLYTFRAKAQIPQETLQQLLWEGIGERRAEGFGRIALYTPITSSITLQTSSPRPHTTSASSPPLSDESRRLAQRMANRILRRRLEYKLLIRLNQLSLQGGEETIRNNQLSRIRTAIRQARLSGNDPSLVLQELEGLKETAYQQFESTKVKDEASKDNSPSTLLHWLRKTLQSTSISQVLMEKGVEITIGNTHADQESLAREYALRLVDSFISQTLAERRNKEK